MNAELLEILGEQLVTHNCCTIPVDVIRLAKRYNIVIDELPLSSRLDGAVIPMPEMAGWYLVVVNRWHCQERKRFTIAHELAHVLLHNPSRGTLCRGRAQEWQANRLASCILMPRSAVMRAIDEVGANSVALASMFAVSHAAMQIRLEHLGIRGTGTGWACV